MNKIIAYIIMFFLVGQTIQAGPIFRFDVGSVELVKVRFSDENKNDISTKSISSILLKSFTEDSYAYYQSLFFPGECHVSEETYWEWKTSFGQYLPEVNAVFYLEKDNNQYAIAQYSMSYEGKSFMLPQAFKKQGDKWYFLSKQENVDMQAINVFFSLASKELVSDLGKQKISKSNFNFPLFINDNEIDGQLLIDHLLDRYQPDSKYSAFMNQYLLFPIKSTVRAKDEEIEKINNYFASAGIKDAEIEHIMNLFKGHQLVSAMNRFAELTKRDVMDIYVEIKELQNQ